MCEYDRGCQAAPKARPEPCFGCTCERFCISGDDVLENSAESALDHLQDPMAGPFYLPRFSGGIDKASREATSWVKRNEAVTHWPLMRK